MSEKGKLSQFLESSFGVAASDFRAAGQEILEDFQRPGEADVGCTVQRDCIIVEMPWVCQAEEVEEQGLV